MMAGWRPYDDSMEYHWWESPHDGLEYAWYWSNDVGGQSWIPVEEHPWARRQSRRDLTFDGKGKGKDGKGNK